jgi:hypothetical protein
MTDKDSPPPDIVEADAKVRKWVREQEDKAAQPRLERAVDRFRRHVRSDTPAPQPPWKDPRSG